MNNLHIYNFNNNNNEMRDILRLLKRISSKTNRMRILFCLIYY